MPCARLLCAARRCRLVLLPNDDQATARYDSTQRKVAGRLQSLAAQLVAGQATDWSLSPWPTKRRNPGDSSPAASSEVSQSVTRLAVGFSVAASVSRPSRMSQ